MSRSRSSRWSSSTEMTTILDENGTLLSTAIWANMTQEQLETYVLHLRTLEITSMLRLPDSALVEKCEAKRSRRAASPDPEYDAVGRRTNTRLQRRRQALEAERHDCIEGIVAKFPAYRTPYDYHRPRRFIDRLFIPDTDFPGINFIGQILGPRGSSLKELQERCGASVVLRGRGSVKQGRSNIRRSGLKDFEDSHSGQPLHAVISADSKYKVQEAKRLVQDVVNSAISSPDEQNKRKREQLRALAIMNGTFRDDEARQHIHVPGSSKIADACISRGADSTDDRFEEEYKMLMEDVAGV